jgi:hypothetical protein
MVALSMAVGHAPTAHRRAMLMAQQRAMGGLRAMEAFVVRYGVSEDWKLRGYAGIWPTMRRAFGMFDPRASHHLVLQDDMLPCVDFLPGVLRIIEHRPNHVIGLFNMRQSFLDGPRRRGHLWWTTDGNVYTGAIVMPVGFIRDFLDWDRKVVDPSYPHDDRRLGAWANVSGNVCWMTVPSLVHHMGIERSTIGHPNHGHNRVERFWLGQTSPLSFDWTPPDDPCHAGDYHPEIRAMMRATERGERYVFQPTR